MLLEEEVGRVGGETRIFAGTQIDNFDVISINVISNNCSPFSDRLHPRELRSPDKRYEALLRGTASQDPDGSSLRSLHTAIRDPSVP